MRVFVRPNYNTASICRHNGWVLYIYNTIPSSQI